MAATTLNATYSGASIPDDPYWIRLVQDEVASDVATVAETARVLDAMYGIDACDDTTTEDSDTDTDEVTQDDIDDAIDDTDYSLVICDQAADGSCETSIKVYRSHLDEDYTIDVAGGEMVSSVITKEEFSTSIAVSNAESYTLDVPVVGGLDVSWAGSGPALMINGNTIYWQGAHAGIINVSCLTKYDLVTLLVYGIDGEQGEATVRVVYHALVEDMQPTLPEASEDDLDLCIHGIKGSVSNDDDTVTCYRDVTIERRCSCSKTVIDTHQEQRIVPCPEGLTRCPEPLDECMHNMGSEFVAEYVDCPDDNANPAAPGTVYALATKEFYEDLCCRTPPDSLPQCVEKITTYRGGAEIENGKAYWRAKYGDNVQFVPVSPAGGICGKHIVRQKLISGCCIDIPAPVWDYSYSAQVLADNSSGLVFWSESQGPYVVRVVGTGFYMEGGLAKKTITVNNPFARIYTNSDPCGSGIVTVTDACGNTVTGGVRSVNGQWVQVYTSSGSGPNQTGNCQPSYWCGLYRERDNTGTFGPWRSTVTSVLVEGTDPASPWLAPWCDRAYKDVCHDDYAYCDAGIKEAETGGYPVPSLPDMLGECDGDDCVGYCDYPMYIPIYIFTVDQWQC